MKKKIKPVDTISNIIRFLLIAAAIYSIITKNYINTFTSVFTLFLTFLPFIIAKKEHIKLPSSFQIIILLFIFAAQYLGEMNSYYLKYWWWDIMLHTFSGIILGFIGYLLVYILNKEEKVNVYLSPFFMVLFSFTFAVALGAIWEIFEFSMDSIFGTNMQKSGLTDTMWDLIVDSIGALFTAFCGWMYETKKAEGWFKKAFNLFMNNNKKLFSDKNDVNSNT